MNGKIKNQKKKIRKEWKSFNFLPFRSLFARMSKKNGQFQRLVSGETWHEIREAT